MVRGIAHALTSYFVYWRHPIEGLIVSIPMILVMSVVTTYLFNRSRCTLEQAVARSGCSEQEIREAIAAGYLSYRRQYVMYGPRSLDASEIQASVRTYQEVKRIQAEGEAKRRQLAEEFAATINESNRRYQGEWQRQQQELERMRRIHAEILKRMRVQLGLIPEEVIAAFQVLGLPSDTPFDDVRQQYRSLVKQHHPDAGGDPKQFMAIHEAYTRITAWIESQS